jgi:hypothetical protein
MRMILAAITAESPVVLLTQAGGDLSRTRQAAGVAGARARREGRLPEPIGAARGLWWR